MASYKTGKKAAPAPMIAAISRSGQMPTSKQESNASGKIPTSGEEDEAEYVEDADPTNLFLTLGLFMRFTELFHEAKAGCQSCASKVL